MPSSLVLFEKDGKVTRRVPRPRGLRFRLRRWNPWYVVVSAALIYALSWLVGDEPMDALERSPAGLFSLLIIEHSRL